LLFGTAEDQMVDKGAVQCFDCQSEAPSSAPVGFARARIAAGMVVSEDDSGASAYRSVGDDRPDGQDRS
jgi:hypothetical protein